MGYTQDEFVSNFSAVANGQPYQIQAGCIELNDEAGRLVIELGAEQVRKLASLAIPFMRVTFKFFDYEPAARENFMQRFDLYYHKGGG